MRWQTEMVHKAQAVAAVQEREQGARETLRANLEAGFEMERAGWEVSWNTNVVELKANFFPPSHDPSP